MSNFTFLKAEWPELHDEASKAQALRKRGQTHDVTKTRETGFGPRYEVEGRLDCSNGRRPRVRTVWQMDEGAVAPRLITAYPLEAE